MYLEDAICEALETIEQLRDKVYPAEALKKATAPFVFYLQHNDDDKEDLNGCTGLCSTVFEVNVVAKTYTQLLQLTKDAKTALRSMQGTLFGDLYVEKVSVRSASPDLKEREVNLYRRMLELQINYQFEEVST